MILKIITSLSALNCLGYIHKEGAQLVATNMAGDDVPNLKREFDLVNSLNPLKHQVIHLIITHPLGEHVSRDQAIHEIEEALAGLGYGNCPFRAMEHFDSGKQHFHIATTPVDFDGKRIDRGGDRFAAKRICRRLEKEAGLIEVTNYKDRNAPLPEIATPELQAADLTKALYAAIAPAVARNKTIGELSQDLLRHGVQMEASFGAKGACGLGFRLLGEPGGYLTASAVHTSFTISKLIDKHHLSYEMDRDDKHLVQMKRKPPEKVQPVLAAMKEPAPASPRVKASFDKITRHLLETHKTRSTYAQGSFTLPSPAAATRRRPEEVSGPAVPTIRAAVLSARLRQAAATPTRRPGGQVHGGVVRPGAIGPDLDPSRPDHAHALGNGLPHPTPGLAGTQPAAARTSTPARDDSGTNLAPLRPDPRGGSRSPGLEGRGGDSGRQAAASPRLPSASGNDLGGGSAGSQRSPRPGAASERQQDAARGDHRLPEPTPAPGARTGLLGLGRERGPGGPGRGKAALSAGAQAQLAIAQKLMAELPRITPPKLHPFTPAMATSLVMDSVKRRSKPAPVIPPTDNLVITAASMEDPPITMDEAIEAFYEYRSASAFAHRSPEPRQEEPKPAPPTPKPEPKPEKKPDTPTFRPRR